MPTKRIPGNRLITTACRIANFFWPKEAESLDDLVNLVNENGGHNYTVTIDSIPIQSGDYDDGYFYSYSINAAHSGRGRKIVLHKWLVEEETDAEGKSGYRVVKDSLKALEKMKDIGQKMENLLPDSKIVMLG